MKLRIILSMLYFFFFCQLARAQLNCTELLDKKPYFLGHHVTAKNSLFMNDLKILRYCGNFIGSDTLLMNGTILLTVLQDQVELSNLASYRDVVGAINAFKKTNNYREFMESLLLYQSLENKKVAPKDWEKDKQLFVRLGFTEADLEDFLRYISDSAHNKFTYKQAYIDYMKEIDAMAPPVH
ncbi:hypothetical protein ACVWYN_002804 [Pedobacter sp. UYP24]